MVQATNFNDSRIYVTFLCSSGKQYYITRAAEYTVPSDATTVINTGLVAIQTQNDTEQDLPTASIALTDEYDWSTLLVPNDYVEIKVRYRSNIFDEANSTTTDALLYNGLVSAVRKTTDANANSRTYIVATEGMAKVLKNINMGTFTEIASESVPLLPDDESTGIAVSGRSSADIINQIFTRFIWTDFTNYNFGINGAQTKPLKEMLATNIIRNDDEAMPTTQDSVSFLGNYNGSILQMIKDTASRPFNELFWSFEHVTCTFNYRPSPFDQDVWKTLPYIVVEPNDVIKEEVQPTDAQQYSIFKVTPSQQDDAAGWIDGVAPITNLELLARYGYKIMNVDTDYFAGVDNDDGGGGSEDANKDSDKDNDAKSSGDGLKTQNGSDTATNDEQAAKRYPDYSAIQDLFSYAAKENNYKGTNSKSITVPDSAGGESTYAAVQKAITKKGQTKDGFIASARGLGTGLTDQQLGSMFSAYSIQSADNTASGKSFTRDDYLKYADPNFVQTSAGMGKNYSALKSIDAMKKDPEKAANQVIQALGQRLGPKQAYELVQAAIKDKGIPTEAEYKNILNKYKYSDTQDGVYATGQKGVANNASAIVLAYTTKLFNWYADNAKFVSGTITINGTSGIEVGKRFYVHDTNDQCYWEYYIESVAHSYSFSSGWTTAIGVTRGFKVDAVNSDMRFTQPYSFYGQGTNFVGGYFGEPDLETDRSDAKSKAASSSSSSDSTDDDDIDTNGGEDQDFKFKNELGVDGEYKYLETIARKCIKKFHMYGITSGYRPVAYDHGKRRAVDVAFPSSENGTPGNPNKAYIKAANWVFETFPKEVAYVITQGKCRDRYGTSGTGKHNGWATWTDHDHYDHLHISGMWPH